MIVLDRDILVKLRNSEAAVVERAKQFVPRMAIASHVACDRLIATTVGPLCLEQRISGQVLTGYSRSRRTPHRSRASSMTNYSPKGSLTPGRPLWHAYLSEEAFNYPLQGTITRSPFWNLPTWMLCNANRIRPIYWTLQRPWHSTCWERYTADALDHYRGRYVRGATRERGKVDFLGGGDEGTEVVHPGTMGITEARSTCR